MTEDDKQFLKEFLRGAGFVAAVGILFIIFVASLGQFGSVPDDKQDTKVVGTYKECDIIQWHYAPLAEYKYFLYCNK